MVSMTILLITGALFVGRAVEAFGYSSSGGNFVIDAGSSNSLVFSVSQSNCDIKSLKYRGEELQYSSQGSHIGSGLGSASVSVQQLSGKSKYIKVTCNAGSLTHYYWVREGESNVYMATYITAEPSIGELRYIFRLDSNKLPSEHPFGVVSTTSGGSAIEGSDVFNVNGQMRSKFYSSNRFIDEAGHCIYRGEDVRACMLVTNYESSSGGPFFRDINTNNGGAYNSLYFYMNSGHAQTEPYRMGLHGPYLLAMARSGTPSIKGQDYSWFSELGLQGFVAASQRGYVQGTASGVPSKFQTVVHWHNSAAQYWAIASGDSFKSPAMKPGQYTMVLYQQEFKVAQSSVSVAAGQTATANIASGLKTPSTSYFKLGEYDGQPFEFRGGTQFLRMHPSDSRMGNWSPATVSATSSSQFPFALWKSVNSPVKISFSLSSDPGAATLRIATTLSFAGARPSVKVNSWTGPTPAAPTKIDSRGVTRGAYRGFGEVYDFSVPSGALRSGSNEVEISVASGSSGDRFLSPNFIFDCVELFK